jgi:hypothetical protein
VPKREAQEGTTGLAAVSSGSAFEKTEKSISGLPQQYRTAGLTSLRIKSREKTRQHFKQSRSL